MLYRTKFSGQINDRKLRRDKNRFLSFSRMKEEDDHDDEADDSDSNSDDEKEDGGQGLDIFSSFFPFLNCLIIDVYVDLHLFM